MKLLPVDRAVAERAAELRGSASNALKLPDALAVATAEAEGAELALTVDRDWEQLPGRRVEVERVASI